MVMISHLKQQIEKLEDYKEQVIILKAERDHLEGKNRVLNEKVKYLSTPVSCALTIIRVSWPNKNYSEVKFINFFFYMSNFIDCRVHINCSFYKKK